MRPLLPMHIVVLLVPFTPVASTAAQPVPPPPSAPEAEVAREPVVSLFPSVGLGGGSHRMGPFNAIAQLDLSFRVSHHVELGARGGFLAAGEPDGRGADGKYAVATFTYRAPLSTEREVLASLAVGWLGISGYESPGEGAFDDDALLVIARLGALWHKGAFLAGAALDCFVAPAEGVSVLLAFLVGFAI